jgi:hypothetical protein
MKLAFRWMIDFGQMIGHPVKLETRDGFRRTGILTRVKSMDLRIQSVEVGLPEEIVLDNDSAIPFTQILTLDLDPK